MGTSSSFGGPGSGTPLLPSWADPPPPDFQPIDDFGPALTSPTDSSSGVFPPPIRPPIPESVPDRFRSGRSNFSRFVASGGTDRQALARAVRDHVQIGSGGSGTAARRMNASGIAATNLLGVLRDIQGAGVAEKLRSLSLSHLVGRPPKEVLDAFTDIVCAPGGPIDEAIARNAYVETVLEINEFAVNLDALTDDQVNVLTTHFMSRSIVNRIANDIGQKLDVKALSGEQADALSKLAFDFVLGAVQDRLQEELQATRTLEQAKLSSQMKRIYEIAFDLIVKEGERQLQ